MTFPTCQDSRFLAACDVMRAQDRLLRSIDATQLQAEDSKATPRAISASPGRALAVTGQTPAGESTPIEGSLAAVGAGRIEFSPTLPV